MQVSVGDIIGTKDGRYGIVDYIVTQDKFLVNESVSALEPLPEVPNQFWTGIHNVASIV